MVKPLPVPEPGECCPFCLDKLHVEDDYFPATVDCNHLVHRQCWENFERDLSMRYIDGVCGVGPRMTVPINYLKVCPICRREPSGEQRDSQYDC